MDETRGGLRLRDGVLALAAAAIAFLLPTLLAGVDSTTTLAGALLAVAVAALLGAAHGHPGLAARTTSARFATRRSTPIVLTTRVTDPTHHPLRPRAPGTV
ncbi:hypothetical protein [Nocardioides plantarum]|uniref:Uncharacterized protein n=1 Tax=Nocardioides plantarum TaxID=29299 RepID=A0ABV5K8C3_9ACTN|nr:hypothetical protein [Nocardioides plantarum]